MTEQSRAEAITAFPLAYKRCLVRNPDLSFPEFLKNPEFAEYRA